MPFTYRELLNAARQGDPGSMCGRACLPLETSSRVRLGSEPLLPLTATIDLSNDLEAISLFDEVDAAFLKIQTLPPPPSPPQLPQRTAAAARKPPPKRPVKPIAQPIKAVSLISVSMNVGDAQNSGRVISFHALSQDPITQQDQRYAAVLVESSPDQPSDSVRVISLDDLVPTKLGRPQLPQHESRRDERRRPRRRGPRNITRAELAAARAPRSARDLQNAARPNPAGAQSYEPQADSEVRRIPDAKAWLAGQDSEAAPRPRRTWLGRLFKRA
ncbi:MAG: hypothetical protein ABW321_12730 [Polyangiales bacterium]